MGTVNTGASLFVCAPLHFRTDWWPLLLLGAPRASRLLLQEVLGAASEVRGRRTTKQARCFPPSKWLVVFAAVLDVITNVNWQACCLLTVQCSMCVVQITQRSRGAADVISAPDSCLLLLGRSEEHSVVSATLCRRLPTSSCCSHSVS